MKKKQIDNTMKVFDEVLDYPANNSFFKRSLNPIKTGLQFYSIIEDIKHHFNFSQYTSEQLKKQVSDQMIQILKMYKDPMEINPIMENLDINGRNAFQYITHLQIFSLLETKIMNQYIIDKWCGGVDINCSINDFATSYQLY